MENYGKAVEYTEDALNSAGTAEEKFGAYTEGIEAKLNSMKAALEGWANNLIDSDLIKGIIDATTGLIKFADTFKVIQVLFVGLMAVGIPKLFSLISSSVLKGVSSFKNYSLAIQTLNTNSRLFSDNILLARSRIDILSGRLNLAGVSMQGLSEKQLIALLSSIGLEEGLEDLNKELIIERLTTQGVNQETAEAVATKIMDSIATNTQTTAEMGLIKALKIRFVQTMKNIKAFITQNVALSATVGILAAVAIGFAIYTAVAKKNAEQLKENVEKAKEHITTIKEEQQTLEDLKQQYIDLSKSENYNDETRKSIQSIQEQINTLVGEEAKNIDLVNGKLDDQIKKLDEISVKNAQNNLEVTYGKLSTLRQNLGSALLTFEENKTGGERGVIESVFGMKGLYEEYSDIYEGLNKNQELTYEQALSYLDRLKEARSKLNPDTENKAWNILDKVIGRLETRITDYDTALNTYNRTQAQAVVGADLFNNKVKIDSKEAYDAYINSLRNAKDENGKLLYSEEAIQAMIEVLSEKFPQFADKIEDTSDTTNALSHDLKTLKDTYETLNTAINEYNSTGSISYDTWEKLINLEDKYLSALVDENGQIKANNKALQDLMARKIEDATLTRMETYVNNLLTAAENGTLNQTLLLSDGIETNTNVRLRNIMAIIASNAALMQNKEQILKTLSAMAQLTSSISLGSDSTKDAKDATEDWEKVLDYANKVLDDHIEKLEKEREAVEKSIEEQIKAKEKEIKLLEAEKEALEDKNEEKNKEIELEELQRNLQKAKQRTMRVYRAELDTWVWEQDPEAVQEAQKELDDFYTEQQIDDIDKRIEALEKEVEAIEKTTDEEEESYDKRLKLLDKQIKKVEEYKKKWNSVKTDYEHAQNEIVAKAQLGADAEKEILEGRIGVLDTFKNGYTAALSAVASETESSVQRINTAFNGITLDKLYEMLEQMNSMVPSGSTEKDRTYYTRRGYSGFTVTTGASGQKFVQIGENQWVLQSHAILGSTGRDFKVAANTPIYSQPYASGTLSAKSGLANVDEKGNELIIPKQGRYRMMEYGDTVVPHNLSQRLFDVASNPLRFIANALNSVKSPNLMTSSVQTSNQSIIHIGTVELPSVTNGENFIKQLQLIAANR